MAGGLLRAQDPGTGPRRCGQGSAAQSGSR